MYSSTASNSSTLSSLPPSARICSIPPHSPPCPRALGGREESVEELLPPPQLVVPGYNTPQPGPTLGRSKCSLMAPRWRLNRSIFSRCVSFTCFSTCAAFLFSWAIWKDFSDSVMNAPARSLGNCGAFARARDPEAVRRKFLLEDFQSDRSIWVVLVQNEGARYAGGKS